MKVVLRSIVLFVLCGTFLFLMHKFELVRFSDIFAAFERRPAILMLLAFVQLISAVVMLLRYRALLGVLGISAHIKQVSAATFVSNAVGQWAPGSLAVVEVLRIGLMIGSQPSHLNTALNRGETVGLKARLALASFADRLIGFLGILLTGFLFSVFLWVFRSGQNSPSGTGSGIVFLIATSGAGFVLVVALPMIARLKVFRHVDRKFKVQGRWAQAFPGRIWNRMLIHLEILRHNIDAGSRHPNRLLKPLFLSVMGLLLTSFSLYLAARALDESLSFLQIVCAYPLISLSTLLPLGFAGIGGYQLVMAWIFGLFSVAPSVVASSGVLQSAVLLVVNTLVGVSFAGVCAKQIRAIFAPQPSPDAK